MEAYSLYKETLNAWTYFKVKAQKYENNIPCKY